MKGPVAVSDGVVLGDLQIRVSGCDREGVPTAPFPDRWDILVLL